MSKQRPASKARDPMMARTDLPLAVRKQLAEKARIHAERQDAAETILKLSCIKLNEMFGLGFERLTKFSVELMEAVKWYYGEDPEYAEAKVRQRLEQMGFEMGKTGEVLARLDDDGKPIKYNKEKEF